MRGYQYYISKETSKDILYTSKESYYMSKETCKETYASTLVSSGNQKKIA